MRILTLISQVQWNKKQRLLALAVVAIIGILLVWLVTEQADQGSRAGLLRHAHHTAQRINLDRIKALSGTVKDYNSADYLQIKTKLASIRSASPQCRFVYLLGRNADGTIFVFADSEPLGSKTGSTPGQLYPEASSQCHNAFTANKSVFEFQVSERWGRRVSALVPIADVNTGAVIAVFGMDIDAADWTAEIISKLVVPAGIALVLLIAFAALLAASGKVKFSSRPLLWRVLPAMILIVVFLTAGEWLLMWQQHRQSLLAVSSADVTDASLALQVTINQQIAGLSAAAQIISSDKSTQQWLRDGAAAPLIKRWMPVFNQLQQNNNITHFYFVDAKRVCLQRLHNPKLSGDRIDRFTMLDAERTGRIASGIETGLLGVFTLRAVQPVFFENKLVGYVELGKGIEKIFSEMHARLGVQLAVAVHKEFLNKKEWEASRHSNMRLPDWNTLPESVVVYSSLSADNNLLDWRKHANHLFAHGLNGSEIKISGINWIASVTPITDAAGRHAADLLIMRDISNDEASFFSLIITSVSVAVVIMVLLIGLIYVLISRADRQISTQYAQLQASENRHNAMISNIGDVIAITNHDGIISYNSANIERLFGWNQNDNLDTNILTNIHPDDTDSVRQLIDELPQKDDSRTIECRYRCKNGSYCWIAFTGVSLKHDSSISGLLINYHDITARRQISDNLKVEQKNLQAMFGAVPIGMLLFDENYIIVKHNHAIERLISRGQSQIIAHRAGSGLGCIHSVEHEKGCGYSAACQDCLLRKAIAQVLRTNTAVYSIETQYTVLINDQQHHLWLNVNAEPVLLDDRRHVIVAIDDITQRKAIEHQLLEKIDELQRFNRLTAGRELTMIELKKEVNALLLKNGLSEKYKIAGGIR